MDSLLARFPHRPDYGGGSIVNLMATIAGHFGVETGFAPLRGACLPNDGSTVVLLVVDGLGYEYLSTSGRHSALFRHGSCSLTSVFPSTTSASLTTFATGLCPRQHGITGWFMHLRELGMVAKVLPFTPRIGSCPLEDLGVRAEDIFSSRPLYDRLPVSPHYVVHEMFQGSPYTRAMTGGATGHFYVDLPGFVETVRSVACVPASRYVYGYWPRFDTLSHMHGIGSEEAASHFQEIDDAFSQLVEGLEGSGATLLVTADHGLVDIAPDDIVRLDDHPALSDCLALPLCGEARAAYCYVRPARVADFLRYTERELSDVCTCVPSASLVEGGLYGPGETNPRLYDRIGDYVLFMNGSHVLVDRLLGEHEHTMVGYHGGLSRGELAVPLVSVRT